MPLTACFLKMAIRGTGKIYLSDINRAIGDVAGTAGFILVSPSANIEPGVGELPVR
jgi:uncharacterized phage protein gp47/JayE